MCRQPVSNKMVRLESPADERFEFFASPKSSPRALAERHVVLGEARRDGSEA
jgi:hypothetical protein